MNTQALASSGGSAPRDSGLAYVCFTHVPLTVDYPAYVQPLFLGSAQHDGVLNLRDVAPEWEKWHPILGSLAGVFAWRKHVLQHRPHASQVGICQYRKFVSNRRLSRTTAPSYRVMDVAASSDLTTSLLDSAMRPRSGWLLPRPLRLDSQRRGDDFIQQYGRVHHLPDFLRFTAEAVEHKLLDAAEVRPFFVEKALLPGGLELGVYPAPFWLETVGKLEEIVRSCVQRFPIDHVGYNARAWGFCAERLGSYVVMRRLRGPSTRGPSPIGRIWNSAGLPRRDVGHLNLISDDLSDYRIG